MVNKLRIKQALERGIAVNYTEFEEGQLNCRAVVVTGAGSGLGRSYAESIVAHGGRVMANDLDGEALNSLKARLGSACAISVGNVADWGYAQRLIDDCVDAFGQLDGLVNNAGVFAIGEAQDVTEEVARRLVEVNVMGTLACGTAAMKHFTNVGSGCIVNVSSGEQMGGVGMSVYSATKGAVTSLTYSWSLELAPYGVRVNAISPLAHTAMARAYEEFTGKGESGEAHGISPRNNAAVVVWLVSERSSGLTGQVVRVGGSRLSLCTHPAILGEYASTDGEWTFDAVDRAFAERLRDMSQPVGVMTLPSGVKQHGEQ